LISSSAEAVAPILIHWSRVSLKPPFSASIRLRFNFFSGLERSPTFLAKSSLLSKSVRLYCSSKLSIFKIRGFVISSLRPILARVGWFTNCLQYFFGSQGV